MLLWRAGIPTSHLEIAEVEERNSSTGTGIPGKTRDFNFSELMTGKFFSCAFHLESESDSLTLIQRNKILHCFPCQEFLSLFLNSCYLYLSPHNFMVTSPTLNLLSQGHLCPKLYLSLTIQNGTQICQLYIISIICPFSPRTRYLARFFST